MNDTRLNGTLLNRSVLNSTRLNATGIARKAKESVEDRVMKSLVLWYDLEKQGATNESMAADPRIIDHSGNGHHAKCYNFAWAGMSGIGGYNMDSSDWMVYSSATYTRPTRTSILITKVSPSNNDLLIAWLSENGSNTVEAGTEFTLPAIRYKVTGVTNGELRAYIRNASGYNQSIENGKEYYFPGGTFQSNGSNNGFEIGWVSLDITERDVDITFELLPLYPNALVSDGVDDYAIAEDLPKFTKDNGYTIIADREIIEIDSASAFVSRYNGMFSMSSFIFEMKSGNNEFICESFGEKNLVDIQTSRQISYQTSTSYNGTKLNVGNKKDYSDLRIFQYEANGFCSQVVLHSLLLFDRDLTAEEIEWVKTNMIGGEQ